MEFGAFDDDLFSENERKPKIATPVNYKPKTLTPQWYMYTEEQAVPEDDPDKSYFYVYRGNHHYYHGEWSSALEAYTRVMGLIAPNNTSMRRLLLESIARCRWRLGEADLAVEIGKKLVEESTNEHQRFTAHSSQALFCHAAGDIEGEAKSLECCLDLRPLSSQHWIQLAKVYLQQIPSTNCKKVPTPGAKDLEVEKQNGHFNDHRSQRDCDNRLNVKRTEKDHFAEMEPRPFASNDSSCHDESLSRNGLDEPRDRRSEDTVHKDERSFGSKQGSHLQDEIAKRLDPHSSNVSDEAFHSRHSKCKSPTVKEDQINLELGPTTSSEDTPRQSTSSAAGQEVLEVETLEKLSLSDDHITAAKESQPSPAAVEKTPRHSSASSTGQDVEGLKANTLSLSDDCIAAAKKLDPNGLAVDTDGDGDKHTEVDFEMEAVKCLLKAKVILKSLQICAVSITKTRNAQLLAEIEELLSTLHLDPDFLQEMSRKMYSVVFEKEIKQGTALS